MASAHNTHVHIPTPTWRALPIDQTFPLPVQERSISDDDTDDEAYIRRHEAAARAERARLAGFLRKKNSCGKQKKELSSSNATPKRLRSSSKPLEAIFPGPLECWQLVEAARNMRGETDGQWDERSMDLAEMRRNLERFSMPLRSFSAVELLLKEQRKMLNRALTKAVFMNRDNGRIRAGNLELPNGTYPNGQSSTAHPKKRLKISGSSTVANPFEEGSIEGVLLDKALKNIDSLESCFSQTSHGVYAAIESLLLQAKWPLPSAKSFAELQASFEQARIAPLSSNARGLVQRSMSELIKSRINADAYPLVAESFRLNPAYKMDGRDPLVTGVRRAKRKHRGPAPSSLHEGKMRSHGFVLNLELLELNQGGPGSSADLELGSGPRLDLEGFVRQRRGRRCDSHLYSDPDNVCIVPQTPSSGATTPSQPSTPSSVRKVKNEYPIHQGDMRLQDPVGTQGPVTRNTDGQVPHEEGGNKARRSPRIEAPIEADTLGAGRESDATVANIAPDLKHQSSSVEERVDREIGPEAQIASPAEKGPVDMHGPSNRPQSGAGTEGLVQSSRREPHGIEEDAFQEENLQRGNGGTAVAASDDCNVSAVVAESAGRGSDHRSRPRLGVQEEIGEENPGSSEELDRPARSAIVDQCNERTGAATLGTVTPIVIPDSDSGERTPPEPAIRQQRDETAGAGERELKREEDFSKQELAEPLADEEETEVFAVE